jgi:hypothetical protein
MTPPPTFLSLPLSPLSLPSPSLTLSYTLSHSFSLTPSLSHSLSLTFSLSLSLSHSLSHYLSLSHTISPSFSLPHSFTQSFPLSLSLSVFYLISLSSPSLCFPLSHFIQFNCLVLNFVALYYSITKVSLSLFLISCFPLVFNT